jgi:hypothetical protein
MVKWLQSHKETPLQRRVAGGNPVGFVRLIADFRGTQFYMRNGLRMKRLERRGLKNSPPASAYARVFPGELFFAPKKSTGTQRPRRREKAVRATILYRLISPFTAFYRFAPRKFFLAREARIAW